MSWTVHPAVTPHRLRHGRLTSPSPSEPWRHRHVWSDRVRSHGLTACHRRRGACAHAGPYRCLGADPMGRSRPTLERLIPLLTPTTLALEHVPVLISTGGPCPWRSIIAWSPPIRRGPRLRVPRYPLLRRRIPQGIMVVRLERGDP